MKLQRHNSTSGGILVVMLVVSSLVGLMLVAYLAMLSSQHKMSQRSQVWNNTIVMSEIGIEEALAHLNQVNSTTNFATNGWAKFGTNFVRTRTNINGGTVGIAIDNAMPPTITATGWLRAPLLSVSMKRIVRVKTKINIQFPDGILSKGLVVTGGGGVMNSYNSTNSLESSNGLYVASRATDHITLATTAKTAGAIDIGNTVIFGNVGTGAGGTYNIGNNGNVGTTAWNNDPAHDGQVEGGHSTDDVNVYIPDAVLPTDFGTAGLTTPGPGIVNLTVYDYLLTNSGDYRLTLPMPNSSKVLVTGKVRFYTTQPVTITSGFVLIGTNSSIEWYSLQDIKLGGGGVINTPGVPKNLSIIGLSLCTAVEYTGGSAFCGSIYAPRANIKMGGNSEAYGAFVGNSITLQGNMSFHYDEALAGDPRKSRFVAASWQEL